LGNTKAKREFQSLEVEGKKQSLKLLILACITNLHTIFVKRRPTECYETEQEEVAHSPLNRAMTEIVTIEKREKETTSRRRERGLSEGVRIRCNPRITRNVRELRAYEGCFPHDDFH